MAQCKMGKAFKKKQTQPEGRKVPNTISNCFVNPQSFCPCLLTSWFKH